MSTSSAPEGRAIPADGKPKLNQQTGMVEYADAEGRKATIMRSDVKSVLARSQDFLRPACRSG